MMNNWAKSTTDEISVNSPKQWQLCYPRRIIPPTGYMNPKFFSIQAWSALQMLEQPEFDQLAHINAMMTAAVLVKHKMPTYFLTPEFAMAVAKTKIPDGIKFSDLKFPLNGMLFVFHETFAMDHFGWHIPFLTLCRVDAGPFPFGLGWPFDHTWKLNLDIDQRRVEGYYNSVPRFLFQACLYYADNAPLDYNGNQLLNSNLSALESLKQAELNDSTAYETAVHLLKTGETITHDPNTSPNPEQDKLILDKVGEFSVKLMLALTARPGLYTAETLLRKKRVNKQGEIERDELWNPAIIGSSYRINRPSAKLGGTHARPKLYWRWGRFTHQSIGKRGEDFVYAHTLPRDEKSGKILWDQVPEPVREAFWKNHKLIWNEPVLVCDDGHDQP